MPRRLAFVCALAAIASGACQRTLVLDDLAPDASPPGLGGTSGTGGAPTDASADGHCFGTQPQPINATPDTPEVVVALDRSSEMTTTPFGAQDTEFTDAVQNLGAQVGQYAFDLRYPTRRAITFYFEDFPDADSGCSVPGCCAGNLTPTQNYTDFSDATMACGVTNSCGPSTDRPTSAALIAAYTHFKSESPAVSPEERYVLLVTADMPETGVGGASCASNDCQAAQTEVSMLVNDLNVWTVIVQVGASTIGGCLQNLMITEGGPAPTYYNNGNLAYAAGSPQVLQSDIGEVMADIANGACRFTLSATPSAPNQLNVQQGQTMVDQDQKNGWTYLLDNGTPRLVLHGSACMDYLDSQFAPQVSDGSCVPAHTSQTVP